MQSLGFIRGSFALLILSACTSAAPPDRIVPEVTGRLEDSKIREASGLARSQVNADVLWIINDNGAKEIVHAIDHSGARLGEFKLKKSKNKDWEDLASFRLDDKPYLMVADIGDNNAKRADRTLYFVEEPAPVARGEEKRAWRVNFTYPDGPRDAEAAAVDSDAQLALVLSKRDLPPRLYAMPLQPDNEETVTATLLGSINSLQKPSRQEVKFAPKNKSWYWQPVGMDISADNQEWLDVLNSKPVRVGLGNFKNAEAIAFGDEQRSVFVTGENKHSRLLRIDFNVLQKSNGEVRADSPEID
jgi:hypothetical protein